MSVQGARGRPKLVPEDVQGRTGERQARRRGPGYLSPHEYHIPSNQRRWLEVGATKTHKEQIMCGHVYRTVAELRAAVAACVDLRNERWPVTHDATLTPSRCRQHGMLDR